MVGLSSPRRVCVLTGDHQLPDATKPGSTYSELDLQYHQTMRGALGKLSGYQFDFLSDHSRLMDRMLQDPPDLVMNLCDTGFRNIATLELHIPALLEMLDIPCTGAPPAAMVLCYDKNLVRMTADSLGIPTARELFLRFDDSLESLEDFSYPALIKPNRADGSVGITQDSVVHNAGAAAAYVARLRSELEKCDVLVQEYLPGPEYGLALVGNPDAGYAELPPLKIDYSELPGDMPPILGYESKTDPTSPYWQSAKIIPADLPDPVVAQLRHDAARLFQRLQCRDYARFDWRCRADGQIALMEVNPNPAWDCDAKLACMVRFAGGEYPRVFELILKAAEARLQAGVDDCSTDHASTTGPA